MALRVLVIDEEHDVVGEGVSSDCFIENANEAFLKALADSGYVTQTMFVSGNQHWTVSTNLEYSHEDDLYTLTRTKSNGAVDVTTLDGLEDREW